MSKKCMICGEENQDVSRFCHMCGFQFSETGDEHPFDRDAQIEKLLRNSGGLIKIKEPKREKKGKKVLLAAVIVIILVFVLFYAASNDKKGGIDENMLKTLGIIQQQQKQNSDSNWDLKYNDNPYFKNNNSERMRNLF